MKKQVYKNNRQVLPRKGFTLIEVVVAMLIASFLLGGMLSAVRTTFHAEKTLSTNLQYANNLRSLLYTVNFAVKNATVSFVLEKDYFAGKMQGLTPGWSYLGVEKFDDHNRRVENFCNYIWQPDPDRPTVKDSSGKLVPNGKHVRQVLASFPPESGQGFVFKVTAAKNSRVMNIMIEQGAVGQDGELTGADIPAGKSPAEIPNRQITTSIFASNSRNVGSSGSPDGIAIAYRSDPIQFSAAQNPSGGRFVMMTDLSGSMRNRLPSSYVTREQALKECLSKLIEKLAGDKEGDPGNSSSDPNKKLHSSPSAIEMNLSSFSDATKQIFTYNGLGLVAPTAANNYGEGPDKDAYRRYFANPKENKDRLLGQVKKLRRGGATNHVDALRTSMAMLKKANDQSPMKNYIVLFTDGDPTTLNFRPEPMATIENPTKRYWFNVDPYYRTIPRFNMLLMNRNFDNGGYTGMVIGGFPRDYDNIYPPFAFFTNQPKDNDPAGFAPRKKGAFNDMRIYNYNEVLAKNYKLKELTDAYKAKKFTNDKEYREFLERENYFGEFLKDHGNYFQGGYYDDWYDFKSPMELTLMCHPDFYPPVAWSIGYLKMDSFPNFRRDLQRNAGWGSTIYKDLDDAYAQGFIDTYKAMKAQGCPVDKIWIIGFGDEDKVTKCKRMVDLINSVDEDKAKYVFADNTDALMQAFNKIVQVINDDLWFLDGPKKQ